MMNNTNFYIKEETMNIKKFLRLTLLCVVVQMLVGCAAMQVAVSKRNLEVQNKMSNTIFLNPVEDAQKTIYLQIRNTSDKSNFSIDEKVRKVLKDKGYQVVGKLDQAHYLLQANILQVGKCDISAAEKFFMGGFGSMLQSTGAGALLGGIAEAGSLRGIAVGAASGGLIDTIANAALKDVTYTVITDLQISERTAKGTQVKQTERSEFKQGIGSVTKQALDSQTGWVKYQTRIMSTANKVNLDFEEALPVLQEGMANSLAGIF